MHPDRKIGFALGILLTGIVAALFFRNEPLRPESVPGVRREAELNQRLRERDVAVFLDDHAEAASSSDDASDSAPTWTMPELLEDMTERQATVPSPIASGRGSDLPHVNDEPLDGFRRPLPPLAPLIGDGSPSNPSTAPSGSQPAWPSGIAGSGNGTEGSRKETPVVPPVDFDEYVVEYGDTLSGIAERFLGSPNRYSEIYELNRDRLPAPDKLRVGSAIRVPRQ